MFPLEVRPGSDPVKLRRTFGRDLLLRGGIAKHRLAGARQDILDELERVEPVVEEGGYIPHGDHRIPEDVPYENYRYYVREKLALLGWRDDEVAQIEPLRGL
jgi:uroporphyrinogen decarboxylase